MKYILNNLKILAFAMLLISVSACDEVLDDDITDFGTGPNFVGFTGSTYTLAVEADGSEVATGIPVRVDGPSVADISTEITVTVAIDPSSSAVEGVNFILDSNTFTLSPTAEDTFTGMLPITIITDGIVPPLDVAPIINLSIIEVSGPDNLVINDKTMNIATTIGYSCPFNVKDYEGTYIATTDEFGIYLSDVVPFQVVAGPGQNQITLVDVAAHPEMIDVIVDVDPSNGSLTVAKQPALNYNNFAGTQYGELRWEGDGTSGTAEGFCIGELTITASYTVDAGSFGQFTTVFTKTAEAATDTDTDTDIE